MKDEIKEILDNLRFSYEQNKELYEKYNQDVMRYIIHLKEAKLLLNYITNLQEDLEKVSGSHFEIFQENKMLKEENRDLSRMCELYSKSLYNAELTDYKSRNEKALEINQKLQNMGILDSRAILWLGQQEKVLQGEDKDANTTN